MEINAGNDYNAKRIAGVYREYQKTLKTNNALDFDDLIFKTVELFKQNEDILFAYQERFRYIMVDEYQDTNTVQFKFVSMLAGKYGNLCVVGDDDQDDAEDRDRVDYKKGICQYLLHIRRFLLIARLGVARRKRGLLPGETHRVEQVFESPHVVALAGFVQIGGVDVAVEREDAVGGRVHGRIADERASHEVAVHVPESAEFAPQALSLIHI